MPAAGEEVEGQWLPGFKCYGAYIGSSAYVKHKLAEKVKQLCDDADKTMTLLKDDHQTAWVMLSRSLSQQMDYLLTMQYPSDTLEAASLMDSRIWAALGRLAGQSHIPREEEGLGVECVPLVPGVPSLEGRSFQRWLVQQPVKLGGLGLRSLVEIRASAFVGGVEQSVPFMVGLGGQPAIAIA